MGMHKLSQVVGLIILGMTLTTGLTVQAKARSQNNLTLAEIRRLAMINVDLPDKTPVLLSGVASSKKDDDSCLCSCRDQAWSCTDTTCKMHNDACGEEKKNP